MIKLLSLDTSTTSTGWGLFQNGKLKDYGNINLLKKGIAEDRIPLMIDEIEKVIQQNNPNVLVVELTVVSRNVQAQRYLTMLLGMLWYICLKHKIEFVTLRPTEWRSYVSDERKGRKREELKKWSINKVTELFNIKDISDDISDAILIGYGYIKHYKDWR